MSLSDYTKAYKLGKKDYQSRLLRGLQPTLEVLDDIIPKKGTYSEVLKFKHIFQSDYLFIIYYLIL